MKINNVEKLNEWIFKLQSEPNYRVSDFNPEFLTLDWSADTEYPTPGDAVAFIPIEWTIERQKDLIRIYLWG